MAGVLVSTGCNNEVMEGGPTATLKMQLTKAPTQLYDPTSLPDSENSFPLTIDSNIWKEILLTQHHDVYCFCGPDLKEKAIGWLKEAAEEAQKIADDTAARIISRVRCSGGGGDGRSVIVFNTVPYRRREVVTIDTSMDDPVI